MVVQAWEKADLLRFKEAGIKVYHPNYEVWDPDLFTKLCPGKTRFIGRENWIRRIVESVDVFGPSHVIPNFVGGVELSKPYGFKTVAEAVKSTAEGLDFFMSHGVVPRLRRGVPSRIRRFRRLKSRRSRLLCISLSCSANGSASSRSINFRRRQDTALRVRDRPFSRSAPSWTSSDIKGGPDGQVLCPIRTSDQRSSA